MERVSLGVFCGSGPGNGENYMSQAYEFGKQMAENSMNLVYGGGAVGLMGAVAKGVMDHGGEVLGVIPHFLDTVEIANTTITKLVKVDSMHERKQVMYDNSDAFVALPGGIGTLDELFEIVTWAQLDQHICPCFIYNFQKYYDHLLLHLEHSCKEGLLSPDYVNWVSEINSFEDLVKKLDNSDLK